MQVKSWLTPFSLTPHRSKKVRATWNYFTDTSSHEGSNFAPKPASKQSVNRIKGGLRTATFHLCLAFTFLYILYWRKEVTAWGVKQTERYVPPLFRKKSFLFDEMTSQNASKFVPVFGIQNTTYIFIIFSFFFSYSKIKHLAGALHCEFTSYFYRVQYWVRRENASTAKATAATSTRYRQSEKLWCVNPMGIEFL